MGASSTSAKPIDDEASINRHLPTELLEEILTNVDAKTVLLHCSRVCRQWSTIAANERFWLRRCIEDGITIPNGRQRSENSFDYARIFVRRPFGRNLIVNGCGETGDMTGWRVNEQRTRTPCIVVEQPPTGCDNTPTSSCFVTSYYWGSKRQVKHLDQIGIDEHLLRHGRLRVTVTEEYTARFDSGAIFRMEVLLVQKVRQEGNGSKYRIVKCRQVTIDEHHMDRRVWQTTRLSLNIPPSGVDAIVMQSSGKDTQFWAGNYGAKMYNARLVIECDAQEGEEEGDEVDDGELINLGDD